MKTAVVYYSLEGNTKHVAEKIAQALNSDLIELTPVTPYPSKGLAKFFHGGKAAVFGEQPALKPYAFDASQYDAVLIGCPVWASSCAAPINTFMAAHAASLKALGGNHIGVFLCQSGNGADKVIAKYKALLNTDHFAAELVLIDPVKRPKDPQHDDELIADFCRKFI